MTDDKDARIAELEEKVAFAEKELLHTLKVRNEDNARIEELETALKLAAYSLDDAAYYHNDNIYYDAANAARAKLYGDKG